MARRRVDRTAVELVVIGSVLASIGLASVQLADPPQLAAVETAVWLGVGLGCRIPVRRPARGQRVVS